MQINDGLFVKDVWKKNIRIVESNQDRALARSTLKSPLEILPLKAEEDAVCHHAGIEKVTEHYTIAVALFAITFISL